MDASNTGIVATFALLMGATWIAFMRFRMKPETSWPLVFYLVLVVYSNQANRGIPPYVLYVSVVCGLLLRFEFLNTKLIAVVKIIEIVCLSVIGYALLKLLVKLG